MYIVYIYIKSSQDRCSMQLHTVCPRSSDPFYVVTYYVKWVTTSWTYSIIHDVFFYGLSLVFCVICIVYVFYIFCLACFFLIIKKLIIVTTIFIFFEKLLIITKDNTVNRLNIRSDCVVNKKID